MSCVVVLSLLNAPHAFGQEPPVPPPQTQAVGSLPEAFSKNSADSAWVVRTATTFFQNKFGTWPLKVHTFTRDPSGWVVGLVPAEGDRSGGGGLIWVARDSSVILLKVWQ
jgi:hypothetical protein